VGLGRTGEPGEDVVAVAVGSMAYGSAAGSVLWYGWLASTTLLGLTRSLYPAS